MLSITLLIACLGINDPVFEEPVKIEAGGEPISVDVGHAAPVVLDLNGDGKKDLLVGQFSGGKVRVYLNEGTDGAPAFEGFTYVEGGGAEASVPSG